MMEVTFLINEAEEGGYYAEAAGVGIFAEADTMDDLKKSIKSGIECYYENAAEIPSFARQLFTSYYHE